MPEQDGMPEQSPTPEYDDMPEFEADEVLLGAGDLARAALLNITPAETIGALVGHTVAGERSLSLLFECTMTGYPGWVWTVSMSRIDDSSEPFVLETELMPGDGALLAPDWVPWSDRVADYRSAQDVAAALAATDELDDVDEEDDALDEDDDLDEDLDDLDEDLDEDDLDDDHGDDALDGIDFETAADGLLNPADFENPAEFDEGLTAPSEAHPAEADEAEGEAESGAPQPPAPTGGEQVGTEEREHREHQ
jgi:hypothetical protein